MTRAAAAGAFLAAWTILLVAGLTAATVMLTAAAAFLGWLA